MLDFPPWRQAFLWLITLACAAMALPSIASVAGLSWPAALPDPKVNLGLDLAGGSHILLEADQNQVRQLRLEQMEENVRSRLAKAEPRIEVGEVSTKDGKVSVLLADPGRSDAAREALQTLTYGAGVTGQRDWDLQVNQGQVVLTPTQAGINQAIDQAMGGAVEKVRTRIDKMGTREPTIIRQGGNRIVVQVPGLTDPKKLKDQLGQTAKLEFKLVDVNATQADRAQGIAQPGTQLVPFANPTKDGIVPLAVFRLGGIVGDQLTDAKASNDPKTNEPIVEIAFNQQGGAKFAKLTSENVGKPFAIILDGKVISAPNINEPILGGQARISGSFTAETAQQLAINLATGALPVDLKVVEERSVGPDLGADSIKSGMIAMGVGTLALMLFMLLTYGRFGVYTCLALIINTLLILGIMAGINATLTLPGIAGFVLTIGAAVDANVLINERIREERARGRKVVQAVEMGYKEASRAIFDANITNVIAAVLMFFFGSGPVKGFAVVLAIGIATSVFTAVTLTRMWVANWLRKARPNDLVL
ncbi:protein translocase subunit SecD [Novosphingobium sp.]|uniref:protein translocase subunit SecD n=1 Tax=Novosphingobium sp. TaxID=1874826 RepID=UPI0025D16794|nr:protein translocase subunit SecD [Novosphingobium sp.]MCC6925728.1 protein translocase subunit SecD [Novosphingobium sp.]